MIRNYLTIAFRNLVRQKAYSFLNIAGLATGITATLLILLYVLHEYSYDTYHTKKENIYRLSREWRDNDGKTNLHLGHLAPPFAPLIENDFPGLVEHAVRFLKAGNTLLSGNGKDILLDDMYFADEDIYHVFSWNLIEGDPSTALSEPFSLILTESEAIKYFDDPHSAIGQQLLFRNFGIELEMKVTGIMQDVPVNSHFHPKVIGSMASVENFFGRDNLMRNFGSNNYATYVLFPSEEAKNQFEEGLPKFIDTHLANMVQSGQKASETNVLNLWPLTSIHLDSHLDSEMENNGDRSIVNLFLTVSLLILLIACINFMNLSTARSMRRAREVGIRKVMGAVRIMLIRQFLAESLIFAILSSILGLVAVQALLPWFSEFTGKEISFDLLNDPTLIWVLLSIVIFIGIAAGLYPAFYLSSYRPAAILKGQHRATGGNSGLRSILVVLQFTISAGLFISVGIIGDQLEFMQKKDLGFDKDHVMVLDAPSGLMANYNNLKVKLERFPGIKSVTLASRIPGGRLLDSQGGSAEVNGKMENINFRLADVHVGMEYLELLGIPLTAGRDFNPDIASDSLSAFILNESAIRALGYTRSEEAIGKAMKYGDREGTIVGVTKDIHFESLHQTIAPIIFLPTSGRFNSVLVRYNPSEMSAVQDFLKTEWSYLSPGYPFETSTVAENFDSQYTAEQNLSQTIGYFGILAVIIASLGLFGLASFITEQRFREIGVRKVMGASVTQILLLLSRGFTLLVLVGFVVAVPVCWFLMNHWLDGFAYRINISPEPFIISALICFTIAWTTISFQTIKAALGNPVDALKET